MTSPRRPCLPCSRPSRRRCFLASRRVEPLTPWTPPLLLSSWSRGSRIRTTVFGGSSGDRTSPSPAPRLRRRRRRRLTRSLRRRGRRGFLGRRSRHRDRTTSRPQRRSGRTAARRLWRCRDRSSLRRCRRSELALALAGLPPDDCGHHGVGDGARPSRRSHRLRRIRAPGRRPLVCGVGTRRAVLAGTAFSALGGWKRKVGTAAGRLGARPAAPDGRRPGRLRRRSSSRTCGALPWPPSWWSPQSPR